MQTISVIRVKSNLYYAMKRVILTILAVLMMCLIAVARQPERGYRGLIEWSNDLRSMDMWGNGERTAQLYTGLSTSHGYQFNPWLFIGGGLVYEHCSKLDSHILAPFIHGRTDWQFGKFTPFGDIRAGYNLSQGGGVYFSPNVGYRFNWGRKAGLNIGVGLTVQGYEYGIYEIVVSPEGYNTLLQIGSGHSALSFFSFRIGLDF